MQFPNPFKKDKPEETAGDLRIEPQMGNDAPAPWDVQPAQEEPPAFAVVGDERKKDAPSVQATPSVPQVEPKEATLGAEVGQAEPTPTATKPIVEPLKASAGARVEPMMSSSKPAASVAYDPNDAPVLGESGSAPAPSAPKKPQPVEPEPQVAQEEVVKKPFKLFGFKKRVKVEEDPDDPINEELYEQRQRTRYRLVGAAALMVAVILVAPFLLDKEDELPTSNLSTEIPEVTEKATTTLETKAAPKPDQGSSGDVDVMPSSVDKETSTAKANLQNEARQPVKKDVKAEKKPEPKKEVAKKPEQPKPKVGLTAPTGKGYYVQVLATSSERNADRLVRELTNQGLPAYKLALEQKAGVIWRVRVGLYKTQDEARGVQGTLALTGHTGKLIVGNQ